MLPEPAKVRIDEREPTFGSVHNYFEPLVFRRLLEISARAREDGDYAADAACIALNHLPSRYIRHDVDLAFFLTTVEMEAMARQVDDAVAHALAYVDARVNEPPRGF